MIERPGKQKTSPRPPTDHFEWLLKGSCPNDAFPVRHLYKDCEVMKRFLQGNLNASDPKGKRPQATAAAEMKVDTEFPETDGYLMIFGGSAAYAAKRQQKAAHREVYTAVPSVPSYLRWSESSITFDRSDHPDLISYTGRYPLVVDGIVGSKRLTKVLMDGGSGLNILYVETLDAMEVPRSCLRPSRAPFHGIIPRRQAMPLGQVDLPVTFGDSSNFRTETLTFEVVDFPRSYHAILGRPCYTKFMAVPNYTYLKLKMPRPKGVIIVGASFRVAYMCEQTCVELASAIMATAELANFHKEVSESPPLTPTSPRRWSPSSPRRTPGRSVSTPTTT